MSYAQQKQRHYTQLSTTMQRLARELEQTRDLMEQTATQMNAMGKFGALHAAQFVGTPISVIHRTSILHCLFYRMMAVEKIEEYVDEHGHLPNVPPANTSVKSEKSN